MAEQIIISALFKFRRYWKSFSETFLEQPFQSPIIMLQNVYEINE